MNKKTKAMTMNVTALTSSHNTMHPSHPTSLRSSSQDLITKVYTTSPTLDSNNNIHTANPNTSNLPYVSDTICDDNTKNNLNNHDDNNDGSHDEDEDDDDNNENSNEDDDFHSNRSSTHQDQQVDLPTLMSELSTISNSVNQVLSGIQHSIEYTSRASILITQLATLQIEDLSHQAITISEQISFISDLFTTLVIKMGQLSAIIGLLPAYEAELDAIIDQLPYLQKRVDIVTKGIKNGTHQFFAPSLDRQEHWQNGIDKKYQQLQEQQQQQQQQQQQMVAQKR